MHRSNSPAPCMLCISLLLLPPMLHEAVLGLLLAQLILLLSDVLTAAPPLSSPPSELSTMVTVQSLLRLAEGLLWDEPRLLFL